MSILVTAIRSGNLEVVKEKFARPVSFLMFHFKSLFGHLKTICGIVIAVKLCRESRLNFIESEFNVFIS